jgi:hypothetical protein
MPRLIPRTTSAAYAVAAASAELLLAACGGGGSDDAKHVAAPTSPPPTSKPSASSSPKPGQLPSTALPKDLTMTFAWPATGNTTKDAVLHDAEQYVRAYNRAASLNSLKDPAYQFYSRDQGLTYAQAQIKANIDGGWAPTGLDRYDSATVALVSATSATVSFCEDQSKNYSKELKTGKVHLTTPSIEDYYRYNLLLFKDAANEVWLTSRITVLEAPSCKR